MQEFFNEPKPTPKPKKAKAKKTKYVYGPKWDPWYGVKSLALIRDACAQARTGDEDTVINVKLWIKGLRRVLKADEQMLPDEALGHIHYNGYNPKQNLSSWHRAEAALVCLCPDFKKDE
uniref:Uncharacterized protein n=1 Tax=viral metagenome TaxID=1070528 RepID=A0A6M3ISP4_9ZZZZ